ncbi:MAG: hypothetical protein JST10_09710 [Bacteroidetes bacterium]|nr:hypothetical protein [Bacteroidota bacterium]
MKSVIFARPDADVFKTVNLNSSRSIHPLNSNSDLMVQSSKSSIKKGKPSYFMAILGVTLVLFFLGIIGWSYINAKKLADYFKESIEVRAYLRGDLNPKDSTALMQYISSKSYVKNIQFVTKEMGKEIYLSEGNDDWNKVLDANPLPNAIYFKVKKEYLNTDSLAKIKADVEQQTYVSDVQYPEALVGKMNENIRKISLVLLIVVIILSIVVIVLIDNTIRLAMFSNRFLIKTMQMVGATRWFIAKPMNIRAIINGAIGGIIACVLVYILILFAESQLSDLKSIRDTGTLLLLFLFLILVGIGITLLSTHRSVLKYLKMKLDDLY